LIWRLPRQQTLGGRSQCPQCDHVLTARDLVPVVSFFVSGRRCRHCRQAVSWRYVVIEVLTAGLFIWAATFVTGLILLRLLFIISVLVVVFVIDLEHYLILDALIFPATLIVLLANGLIDYMFGHPWTANGSLVVGGLLAAVLAAVAFFVLWYVSSGRWMGFGDVKLMLFIGVAVGWPLIGVAVMLAFLIGSVVSLVLLAGRYKQLTSRVPFGTFASISTLLTLIYGHNLLEWYLRLIQ
jgi:leader peptidase (prepilin peptidase) / N-methyltransferase